MLGHVHTQRASRPRSIYGLDMWRREPDSATRPRAIARLLVLARPGSSVRLARRGGRSTRRGAYPVFHADVTREVRARAFHSAFSVLAGGAKDCGARGRDVELSRPARVIRASMRADPSGDCSLRRAVRKLKWDERFGCPVRSPRCRCRARVTVAAGRRSHLQFMYARRLRILRGVWFRRLELSVRRCRVVYVTGLRGTKHMCTN